MTLAYVYLYISLFMIEVSYGMLCGGTVAWWLVHSSQDQAGWVLSPGRGHHVVLSWARHLTLTVALSPPKSTNGYQQIVGET